MSDQVNDQDFKAFGERLALLLASSAFPEKVKQSWAELIPQMDMAQLDRLSKILEQNISEGGENEEFAEQVLEATQQAQQAELHAQEEALDSLNEIEKQLDELK